MSSTHDSDRQDRNPNDSGEALGRKREHGGIPTGAPRQPVSEESQFMPDTGDTTSPGSARAKEDLMDEARDGFLDRYPPKGQTD